MDLLTFDSGETVRKFQEEDRAGLYIQNPPLRPEAIVRDYPSHLHIDLLETAQGRGIGKAMMNLLLDTLREQGSKGVHLGMGAQNSRAFTFYTKLGFTLLDKNDDEWTMGLKL